MISNVFLLNFTSAFSTSSAKELEVLSAIHNDSIILITEPCKPCKPEQTRFKDDVYGQYHVDQSGTGWTMFLHDILF